MRHRVASVAVGALLALAAVAGCGSTEVGSGTPGFERETRDVDTSSPFTIARPTTTEGATTVPGPSPTLPMPDVFRRPTTTTGPAVTAVPTTVLGEIAAPASRTPTCESMYLVASAGRDVQLRFLNDPNADFAAATGRLVAGFTEAINVLTPRLGEGPDPDTAVASLARIQQMRALADTAVTLEDAGGIFYPLQTPRAAGEPAGWNEILAHLTTYCPAVPKSFGIVE